MDCLKRCAANEGFSILRYRNGKAAVAGGVAVQEFDRRQRSRAVLIRTIEFGGDDSGGSHQEVSRGVVDLAPRSSMTINRPSLQSGQR